jgi:hypothetical protein
MKRRRRLSLRAQRKLTIIEIVAAVAVLLLLVAGARRTYMRLRTEKPPVSANATDITWAFDGTRWQPSGTPPQCEDPLFPVSPIDTSLVTSMLYPGQYRGGDYKAHGGFRFDNVKSGITVRLPMDAQLTGMTNYIEQGDVQYLLTFTNACGIAVRFDHVYTLSSRLQTVAATLPPPQENNSRSLPLAHGPKFAAGEVVATAVGMPATKNITMDFGVYDLRKPNAISSNTEWAMLHADKREQTYYGVCWLGLLPVTDMNRVKNFMSNDQSLRTVSDYCQTSGGNTLQYNDGRPV